MTSPDGINWTSQNCPAFLDWRSVTYGDGLYVAVAFDDDGLGNQVMISPDGINWSVRASSEIHEWISVTYANGIFVAVSLDGMVMTSSDAISPGIPTINSITTLNTSATVVFTAPASSGYSAINNYEYSLDNGSTWIAPSPAITTSPLTITGLTGGTTYAVQLRAVNRVGSNCGSLTSYATTCSPSYTTETISACDSYTWHGTTYTSSNNTATWTGVNATGCDSVVTLHLTINTGTHNAETRTECDSYTWHSNTYTSTGNYTYSYTNVNGCASVDTLHLTINASTHNVETRTECDSYTWHSNVYTSTGTYTYSYTNGNGCASVDTLHLTINASTHNAETRTECDSYTWHSNVYISSGTYTYNYTNGNGCASVDTLHLTINAGTHNAENRTECDSYTWHSNVYTSSGTYTYSYTNGNGCASVVTLNLTIKQPTSSSSSASACVSYLWHGTTYTTSGAKTWTGTNAAGCDSVVTLNLTINQPTSSSSIQSACVSYLWHGTTYTTSGVKTWTGTNAAGCDSVVTLNLTINQVTTSTTTQSATGSYTWNGNSYTSSGTYTYQTTNSAGCDSTATLNLTINQIGCTSTSSSETTAECNSYSWHGNIYTTSGVYSWTGTNAAGCDSVVTLHLTIKQPTTFTLSESVCISYLWHGTTYTTSGAKTWTGTNAAGCDSVVTLNLTINQPTSSSSSQSACGSYLWHGTTYTTSGAKTWTGTNAAGCDSVVTLNLTINQPTSSSSSVSACVSYLWHGTTYTTSGVKTWIGTNAAGCDSVVTLILTIKQPTTSSTTQSASGSYSWNGNTYTSSGTYTYQTTNAAGCDSIATLYLTINNITSVNIANVCTYIGTNQTLAFTANVAGASSYAWTLPLNTQLVSGQGTRNIQIKILNGFASQSNKQIRVTPSGGSLQVIYLLAQAPVTPATIVSSSNNICGSIGTNVPVIFTIPKVVEASSNGITTSSYIWTAQNGTTNITHVNGVGENDTTVAITFASNFTSSNVTVQALNACGVSAIRSYLITRNNPTVGVIGGPTNSCEYIGNTGTLATYSVPAVTNINSYSWTLPIGATDVSGQGTNTVTFKYPAGYTGGSISVTGRNGCGTSSARTLSISRLLPGAPGNIDVINTQVCPNREYSYSLASIPSNATSLLWTVPTGATIVNGQGTTSMTVSYPNGVVDGNVIVKGLSNCGTSSTRTLIIKLAPCPTAPGTTYTKGVMSTLPTLMEVKVFPNPTTSSFNLQVTTSGSKSAIEARVLDLQGRLIKTMSTHPNENISLGAELKAGVYILEVLQGEERKMVRVVKY